ncbi:MAG: hypothetical protein PF443_09320 [Allgaiera sp.]|jgi:hypothetical protein|nr:hypothetical protein [Allgaiera sp.]
MSEEFERWKHHDGGPAPRRTGFLEVRYEHPGIQLRPDASFDQDFPGWLWHHRRVRVGLFRWKVRPVCDEPLYAPIIAYRFRKPPRASVETVAEMMHEITHPAVPAASPAGAHPVPQSADHSGCGDTPLTTNSGRLRSPGFSEA